MLSRFSSYLWAEAASDDSRFSVLEELFVEITTKWVFRSQDR